MKNKLLLTIFFLFCSLLSTAQTKSWQQIFDEGINKSEYFLYSKMNSKNEIIVAGYHQSLISDNLNFLINKYSSEGNLIWSKSYDSVVAGNKLLYNIVIDKLDNIYLIGSITGLNEDICVVKYDDNGTQKWIYTYDGGDNEVGLGATMDDAMNLYVYCVSDSGKFRRGVTVKLDSKKNLKWMKNTVKGPKLGNTITDLYYENGYIYAIGTCYTTQNPNFREFTIKYDTLGNEKYYKFYEENQKDGFYPVSVKELKNKLYTSGTFVKSNTTKNEIYFNKYDLNGALLKSNKIISQNKYGYLYNNFKTYTDKSFLCSVFDSIKNRTKYTIFNIDTNGGVLWKFEDSTYNYNLNYFDNLVFDEGKNIYSIVNIFSGNDTTFIVFKIDSSGKLINKFVFDSGFKETYGFEILIPKDNKPVVCGGLYYNATRKYDGLLVKFNELLSDISEYKSTVLPASIYPNPTHNTLHIQLSKETKQATSQIYNLQGKLMGIYTVNEQSAIDVSQYASGLYTVQIQTATGSSSYKWLKE